MKQRRALLGLALVASMVAAACTSGSSSPAGFVPPVKSPGSRLVYVAVGASETVGVGSDDPLVEAWPQVFFRSLPAGASFVNVGVPGATVEDALAVQVPQALALKPDLVTVWLNVNDIIAEIPPDLYGRQVLRLLEDLRRGGATRVLVANTPPVENLPAYRACLPFLPTGSGCDTGRRAPTPGRLSQIVSAYNRAIASDAAQTGAQVVNLQSVALAAERNHTFASLVSGDGFHPSDAGHRAVAAAFAKAYRSG